MRTKIIAVGNSRGVRIPKALLLESGLQDEVEITARDGELIITAIKQMSAFENSTILSETALSRDWLSSEEDEAWSNL